MRIFYLSNCSNNLIHFNFNLILFALVCRAPSGNSIVYVFVNKVMQIEHYKGKVRNKIAYMAQYNAIFCRLK